LNHQYSFKLENGETKTVNLPFVLEIESNWEKIRALTFWTKEPETIYWIGDFDGEKPITFWDIGANIGVYSLFCACVHPNANIYAFEPQSTNFLRLLANIHINGFGNQISPQFMALSNKNGFQEFTIANPEFGASGGQLDAIEGSEKYEVPVFTGDGFAEMTGIYPDYVKIDVDGNELNILNGMVNVLKSVKGILVEVNDTAVSDFMDAIGFIPDRRFNLLRGAGWKRNSNTNLIFKRG